MVILIVYCVVITVLCVIAAARSAKLSHEIEIANFDLGMGFTSNCEYLVHGVYHMRYQNNHLISKIEKLQKELDESYNQLSRIEEIVNE